MEALKSRVSTIPWKYMPLLLARKAIFSSISRWNFKRIFLWRQCNFQWQWNGTVSTKLQLWVINTVLRKIKIFRVAWELDHCLGRISQHQHYWHLEPAIIHCCMSGGRWEGATVLCIDGCLATPLASAH